MKITKFIIITLIILLIASSLTAIESGELYQKLINKYNKIETFQANIIQTSYYSEIDYTNISQGKIYNNSDKIFIEYTSPKVEKISLADNIVKIYQEEDDRLILTYADSSFATLNIKYLIERIWNDETLTVTENDSLYVVNVLLTEDNAIANIDNVEFSIDKTEMLVQRVRYQDDLANEVDVLFTNIILNALIKDELWEIKTTEDTQIIDYRE